MERRGSARGDVSESFQSSSDVSILTDNFINNLYNYFHFWEHDTTTSRDLFGAKNVLYDYFLLLYLTISIDLPSTSQRLPTETESCDISQLLCFNVNIALTSRSLCFNPWELLFLANLELYGVPSVGCEIYICIWIYTYD